MRVTVRLLRGVRYFGTVGTGIMADSKINFDLCPTFKSLSLQKQTFVLEYLKDFNGTQAAIRAKYSKKTANEQAARLLASVSIQQSLAEVSLQVTQLGDIADVKEIAEFLTRVKRGNMNRIASWTQEGMVFTKDSSEMDDDTAALIKKIKVTEKTSAKGDWTETKTDVELHDPIKAAELLGRYHGMWQDKVEHSGDLTVHSGVLRVPVVAPESWGKKK